MYLGSVAVRPAFAPVAPVGTVAYEAQRLDRLFPGWWETIDEDTLVMSDGQKCVIGQGVCGNPKFGFGHGHYGFAMDVVRADAEGLGQSPGLDVYPSYLYRHKVPEWKAEIKNRRRTVAHL